MADVDGGYSGRVYLLQYHDSAGTTALSISHRSESTVDYEDAIVPQQCRHYITLP